MYDYPKKLAGLDRLTGPEKLLDEEDSLIMLFSASVHFWITLKTEENSMFRFFAYIS